MLYLRLACLLAGFLVLLGAPAMLYPTGVSSNELAPAAGTLISLLLAAAAFFFIALSGHRIRYAPSLRRLCTVLLCAPFLAGAAALWNSATPTAMWLSGLLLGFTLSVAAILVSPLLRGPSPSRLRAREARLLRRQSAAFELGSESNYLPIAQPQQLPYN